MGLNCFEIICGEKHGEQWDWLVVAGVKRARAHAGVG